MKNRGGARRKEEPEGRRRRLEEVVVSEGLERAEELADMGGGRDEAAGRGVG